MLGQGAYSLAERSTMKLSCQETLVSAKSFVEKADVLQELGFEGVELSGFWGPDAIERLKAHADEVEAALEGRELAVSSICGGYAQAFVSSDVSVRKTAIADCKEALKIAGRLRATGPILVPIFGPPQLPDLWPAKSAVELEKELLVSIVGELAPVAAENSTKVILEPLNRYETHLLKTLDDAVEICEMAGNPPGLKIMADFFHMNIEELDIAESIRRAGDAICHVHLADSTRKEPGSAHTDFRSGFQALKDIGYGGFMAFECGLTGDDPLEALGESARYLKDIIRSLK